MRLKKFVASTMQLPLGWKDGAYSKRNVNSSSNYKPENEGDIVLAKTITTIDNRTQRLLQLILLVLFLTS